MFEVDRETAHTGNTIGGPEDKHNGEHGVDNVDDSCGDIFSGVNLLLGLDDGFVVCVCMCVCDLKGGKHD